MRDRVIIGGIRYVIGGWSQYNVELSEVKVGNGECLKPKYDFKEIINAIDIVTKNVDTTRIMKQLQKLYEYMRKKEKEILNFDKFARIPTFTSYDLNYIMTKSVIVDLYLLKSLYVDICNYLKADVEEIDTCELYNIDLPLNNKNILELEQKNLPYMENVEKMFIKIISVIENGTS